MDGQAERIRLFEAVITRPAEDGTIRSRIGHGRKRCSGSSDVPCAGVCGRIQEFTHWMEGRAETIGHGIEKCSKNDPQLPRVGPEVGRGTANPG
jgi:hypothetical protein